MRPGIAVISSRRRRRGSSGPVVVVTDTFTRANNAASLGSTEGGSAGVLAWSALKGTWGVDTNKGYLPAAIGNDLVVVDSGVSVCSVSVTITGVTANNAGLAFSVTDVNNGWGLWGGTGGLFLVKDVAGAQTIPASDAIAVTDGSVLTASRNGSSIVCYVNGVQRLTVSDAFNSSATKHGLQIGGADSTHRWDNFQITTP